MKQINKRKITKPTFLAMAIALAFPIMSFAANPTDIDNQANIANTQESLIEVNDNINFDNAFDIEINQSISSDNKKINYDVIIKKNTNDIDDLYLYFNIAKSSNISNLEIESISSDIEITNDDIKKKSDNDFDEISVNLKDSKEIKISLSADIGENVNDNLAFDLSLFSKNKDYRSTYRFISKINDNKLESVENAPLSSLIKGNLIDENLIWTDYLLNTTEEDLEVKYPIELSDNQNYDDSKLILEIFELQEDGYKSLEKGEFELGEISGLILTPNTLVKISFETKINPEENEFSFNGINLIKEDEKEIKAQEVKASDEKPSNESFEETGNSVLNLIDEISKGTDEINNLISDDDKKINEDTNTQLNSTDDIFYDPSYVMSLKDEIEKTNEEIKELIKDKDIDINKESSNEDNVVILKDDSKNRNKDIDVLISEIDQGSNEIQDLIRDDNSNLEKSSVMNDPSIEDSKDIEKLTKDLDETTIKIDEIVRQVKLSIESDEINKNPEELKKIAALLNELKVNQENSKAVLEKEISKENENINNGFRIVIPGYSEKRYEELRNIVNQILNGNYDQSINISKDEISNKYPSIAYYLNNLEIRSDLLK